MAPATSTSSTPQSVASKGYPATPGDTSTTETLEDLKRRVAVLEHEKIKEERARNYAQLERDRIFEFWQVTKNRLKASEAAVRRLSLELEELQCQHVVDIKAYRARIVSLVAEQAVKEAEAKAAAALTLQQKVAELEATFIKAEEEHKAALEKLQMEKQAAEDAAATFKFEYSQKLSEQQAAYEKQLKDMQTAYDAKLHAGINAVEERCNTSMHAVSQQRDAALAEAAVAQELILKEAVEHHAATVGAQLELIAALKGDVAAMKQKETLALEEVKKLQHKLKKLSS